MKTRLPISLWTLFFVILVLWLWRLTHVVPNELSWDVLGYYLYLPATFVHHDFFLNQIEWLQIEAQTRELTDTLYMVTQSPKGGNMYFFLMGMAFLYLPFFLIAHLLAPILGFPADGFSEPYIYAMVIGALCYTSAAIYLLRKILLRYFSEITTAILLLFLAFTTNAINHLAIKNLETVNFLFFFVTAMVYLSIKWHENHKRKYLILIFLTGTISTLIKPSEIFIFLLPLLWNVTSFNDVKTKIILLFTTYKWDLFWAIISAFVLVFPQMLYWFYETGKPIYDSYKNPGIGIDWWNPHILEALFSFRKGWLIYTPGAVFMLIGLYFLWKKNASIAWAISVYAGISFYIMISWTEWWYGAGYSFRPVVTLYPVLLIGMGYFLEAIRVKKILFSEVLILLAFFTFLNIFQYQQFRNFVIHPYRTTFAYYKIVFLKQGIPENAEELLLLDRAFSNEYKFPKDFPDAYTKTEIYSNLNEELIPAEKEFGADFSVPFQEICPEEYAFILWEAKIEFLDSNRTDRVHLVMSMDRKNGSYSHLHTPIKTDSTGYFSQIYLTPELRSTRDKIKIKIWNEAGTSLKIRDVKIHSFVKQSKF